MAAPVMLVEGGDFYGALLACVRSAECDGYAELPLAITSEPEIEHAIAALRGFSVRVRFAFRATPSAIERLHLQERCDGWPVEKVVLDHEPGTIVLVTQRRQGLLPARG